jgi:hypothetical protein
MAAKPVLWITRKLSPNTLLRARESYDVLCDEADQPADADTIIARSAEADACIPCHSEHFSADVVARLDPRLKIVANHSVGVDHCDLVALKHKGIVVTNTPDVLSDATAEIDRYIAIPSQALAYKVGALKIQDLRAKSEEQLGSKFDIREFHAEVLNTGALPLSILEAKIDRWIAAKKAD